MIAGQREQMVGILQERYGYAKKRAEKGLTDFTDGIQPFSSPR